MEKCKKKDKFSKRQDYFDKIKHYCKCGHTVYVPKRNVFVYCTWCNKKVFQSERSEFEYNILKSMGKVNNKEVK